MSISPTTAPYRDAFIRGADGLYYRIGSASAGGGGVDEVHTGPTPPSSPFDGQMWVDTTGSGGNPKAGEDEVYTGPTPPPAPFDGQMWVDTTGAGAPPDAAVILTGTATPTNAIGAESGYYLDTDSNILYGPKTGTTWPVALVGVPIGGTSGQVLAKTSSTNFATVWNPPATGGGGSAFTRDLLTVATPSLAVGAAQKTTVTLAAGYRIRFVSASVACRVRLYLNTTYQTSDEARAIGVDPINDHGVVFDVVLTSDVKSFHLSPEVDGYDTRSTPTGVIPITITNLSTAAAVVSVDLAWIRTE